MAAVAMATSLAIKPLPPLAGDRSNRKIHFLRPVTCSSASRLSFSPIASNKSKSQGTFTASDPHQITILEKMVKQKEGGAPAIWEMETTLIFCDICIKEIELGNRPTTHFSKEGWRNLSKNFNERTGRTYDRTQLKNKWDQLKKEWKLWKDLMRGETGIGWNPLKKTIEASNEWWTEKLQVFPSAKKFRYNGIMPELEEKLDIMFGRVVATGANACVPNSGVLPPDLRDVDEVASLEEDQQDDEENIINTDSQCDPIIGDSQRSHNTHPITHKRKRIRTIKPGGRQMFIDHIEKLVNAAESISSAVQSSTASRKGITIADALEAISKIPEIFDDPKLYEFAVLYIQDRKKREAFMGLPNDRKVWFLERRHQTTFTSLL